MLGRSARTRRKPPQRLPSRRHLVEAHVMLACILGTFVTVDIGTVAAQTPRHSFDLVVPRAPVPVTVDDDDRLAYELHITNFAAVDLELVGIEVLDADGTGRTLAEFREEPLAELLERVGPRVGDADIRVVAPGARTVAYFWLAVDGSPALPDALTHRITFREPGAAPAVDDRVTGGQVAVLARQPAVLGAPLRGGPWVAIYYPTVERGHRRVLFALNGRAHIPARFAIDWMKLDGGGKLASGDESRVSNWHGYGAEVLAVSDATVVAVRDTMTEGDTVAHLAHGMEGESGNYITLDLGGDRYVSYEHLRPGSVRVRAGERVHEGQAIAQLGYTGDSAGPHLHLHVSDGGTPLHGEGVPFVIRSFELFGAYDARASIGEEPWTALTAGAPEARTMEFPAPLSVVRFDDAEPQRDR